MRFIEKSTGTLMVCFLVILLLLPNESVKAQSSWGVGASFETRDTNPGNGFGLRLERSFLSRFPVIDFNLRLHFSYFTDEVGNYKDLHVPAELDVYDFGLAATGGISFGLLKPYAGGGLGSENLEGVQTDAGQQSFDEDNIYWNFYGGVQFPILPVVKPFVEYRFTRLFDSDGFDVNHNSRLAFGVMLRF